MSDYDPNQNILNNIEYPEVERQILLGEKFSNHNRFYHAASA